MIAVTFEATATVLTGKVAVVIPDLTVTDSGTVAEVEVLESFTNAPPDGAGPVRVTVPVEDVPPSTVFGLRPTDATPGAVISQSKPAPPP